LYGEAAFSLVSSILTAIVGNTVLGYAGGDVLGFANELSYATILTVFALGGLTWI